MNIRKIKYNKYWIPFLGFALFHIQDEGPLSINEKEIDLFANWHACWMTFGLPLIVVLIILL